MVEKLGHYYDMLRIKNLLFFFICLDIMSCKKEENVDPISYVDANFSKAIDVGEIENTRLLEVSGIVSSQKYPGFYWAQNDSGNPNSIYLLDSSGKGTKEVGLKGSANRDWEDISLFVESNGSSTIFLGDFGDNNNAWPFCTIYWLNEPEVTSLPNFTSINTSYITFTLPDGSRDVECMLIDQKSKDIYLISKRDFKKRLYKIAANKLIPSSRVVAEFIEELNFSIPPSMDNSLQKASYITAGSVSKDNSEILIKSYTQVFYWRRKSGERIEDALMRPSKNIDYVVEPQGEAISFDAKGSAFVTISESLTNSPSHLFLYKKLP